MTKKHVKLPSMQRVKGKRYTFRGDSFVKIVLLPSRKGSLTSYDLAKRKENNISSFQLKKGADLEQSFAMMCIKGVVMCGEGVVYLSHLGGPAEIGLQLGKACYPWSW